MSKKMPPVHPGEILKVEFLDELKISPERLAKDTGMPPARVSEIIAGERAVCADTALRLARYFGTTPTFWQDLQSYHDLEVALDRNGSDIEKVVPAAAAAAG